LGFSLQAFDLHQKNVDGHKDKKMITVQILREGIILKAITAIEFVKKDSYGNSQYRTSNNKIVEHTPKDGDIVLAKKLLECL
jgi:hypothetical protein